MSAKAAWQAFFNRYSGLRTLELASIAGKDGGEIFNWRTKCGIPAGKKIKIFKWDHLKKYKRPEIIKPLPREVWDNKEWFENKYLKEGESINFIAKMIGIDRPCIYVKFKKWGIPFRGKKPLNKCCTRDWLYSHYVVQKLSLDKCGKLAGVKKMTIARWLAKYQLPIRTVSEAAAQSYENGAFKYIHPSSPYKGPRGKIRKVI